MMRSATAQHIEDEFLWRFRAVKFIAEFEVEVREISKLDTYALEAMNSRILMATSFLRPFSTGVPVQGITEGFNASTSKDRWTGSLSMKL